MKSSWPVSESGEASIGARRASNRLPISGATGGRVTKIVGKRCGHVLIERLLLQLFVFKQLAEWCERGIDVRQPQQHQLFEGSFAVRQSLGCAVQPFGCGLLASIDRYVRKLLGKGEQQPLHVGRLDLRREPTDRLREDGWIDFLAIASDQRMIQFVNHAHCKQCACIDSVFRASFRAPQPH